MMLRRIRYWLNRGERARLLREEMEIVACLIPAQRAASLDPISALK
jgi:hypothetical protein